MHIQTLTKVNHPQAAGIESVFDMIQQALAIITQALGLVTEVTDLLSKGTE